MRPPGAIPLGRLGRQPYASANRRIFKEFVTMRQIRFALRTLVQTPLVTGIVVISLALGIGANAAIFSVFEQVLLRALPVAEPDRLVNLSAPGPNPGSQSCGNAGDCQAVFSYPMFRDLERVQTSFTGIAAHRLFAANLSYRGQTESGGGLYVSGGYFPVLGLQPALGRLLDPSDDRSVGQSPVVVLSYAYWRSRFQEDPSILNEPLTINGQLLTIVGVAPRGFDGTTLGSTPEVFVPITMRGLLSARFDGFENRRNYWIYLFARLRPEASIDQALAAINVPYAAILGDVEAALQENMSDQTMARFVGKQIALELGPRGQSTLQGEARGPLTLLFGVTAFVLIIACANIANLLLARGVARAGEMAVRLSIGANRWQLVRQLLTEAVVLAVAGGVAGLFVGRWTLVGIGSLLPARNAEALTLELDGTVLLFAAIVTVSTGLLFGLFPALHSTRPDLVSALKGQAGQSSGARTAARFRTSLATVQIALSMVLLVAAGLFTRSLLNVSRVDLGLRADQLITFSISPEQNGYTPEQSSSLFLRLTEDLEALPGVASVSSGMVPVLGGQSWGNSVSVEGFEAGPDTDINSRYNEVGPGYLRTLGIPLIAGRGLTRADVLDAPKVAVVNEQFAQKFNLGREAVGKRMAMRGRGDGLDIEIVGLAQDSKYNGVKREIPPLFMVPSRQNADLGFNTFYVRSVSAPEPFLATIPRVVARLDPDLPVDNLRTMETQVRNNLSQDRFISVLSAAFAGLATLLAAIGLYGVLAYTVARRTQEIGLRMALGAAPGRVRRMILHQVVVMTAIGGLIGLGAAVALGRFAESMLYELQGRDPVILGLAAAALALVALGAGFIPAQRASQLEPMRALRHE
ncbi:MAG TPA: multidrug ABC transporter substrate-binding protein [Acidobacteria bacterium]|nr:multidrug ABC transporter substrate-binding protein [Acidobacteriota bacterium]HAK57039.1 multidrug ABC transporter substrate-binding protein [Acidobacteriota bacterium]